MIILECCLLNNCGKDGAETRIETNINGTKTNEEISIFINQTQKQIDDLSKGLDQRVRDYSIKEEVDKFFTELDKNLPKDFDEMEDLKPKISEFIIGLTKNVKSQEEICPEYKKLEVTINNKKQELDAKLNSFALKSEQLVVRIQAQGATYVGWDEARNRNVTVTSKKQPYIENGYLIGRYKLAGTSNGKTVLGAPCLIYHYTDDPDEDNPNILAFSKQLNMLSALSRHLKEQVYDKTEVLREKISGDTVKELKEVEGKFYTIKQKLIDSNLAWKQKVPEGYILSSYKENTNDKLLYVLYRSSDPEVKKSILVCYDGPAGDPKWSSKILDNIYYAPIFYDNSCLYIEGNEKLYCIDKKSGHFKYKRNWDKSAPEEAEELNGLSLLVGKDAYSNNKHFYLLSENGESIEIEGRNHLIKESLLLYNKALLGYDWRIIELPSKKEVYSQEQMVNDIGQILKEKFEVRHTEDKFKEGPMPLWVTKDKILIYIDNLLFVYTWPKKETILISKEARYNTLAVHNNTILYQSQDDKMHNYDFVQMKEIWNTPVAYSEINSPLYCDTLTCFFSNSNSIFALDIITGQEKWTRKIDGCNITNAMIYNSYLFFKKNNTLYLIEIETGKTKSEIESDYNKIQTTPNLLWEFRIEDSGDMVGGAFDYNGKKMLDLGVSLAAFSDKYLIVKTTVKASSPVEVLMKTVKKVEPPSKMEVCKWEECEEKVPLFEESTTDWLQIYNLYTGKLLKKFPIDKWKGRPWKWGIVGNNIIQIGDESITTFKIEDENKIK